MRRGSHVARKHSSSAAAAKSRHRGRQPGAKRLLPRPPRLPPAAVNGGLNIFSLARGSPALLLFWLCVGNGSLYTGAVRGAPAATAHAVRWPTANGTESPARGGTTPPRPPSPPPRSDRLCALPPERLLVLLGAACADGAAPAEERRAVQPAGASAPSGAGTRPPVPLPDDAQVSAGVGAAVHPQPGIWAG